MAFVVGFIDLRWTDDRGTAPMKLREEGGVVDKDLNVYGTSHLKVAGMRPALEVC